jgi:hypothetical protein
MAGEECESSIRKSWSAIDQISKTSKKLLISFKTIRFLYFPRIGDGLTWLSKAWRTCKPLKATDINDLKDWLTDVYTNLGMTDYPYATSFLMPLPANPIVVRFTLWITCKSCFWIVEKSVFHC